jgi:hypothetical protein
MFVMTCAIKIANYKPVPPNSVKWVRSIDNYSDTCTIRIPAICRLQTSGDHYEMVPTAQAFKEGDPVEVWAGYDNKNYLRFKGFIRRVNFSIPLELECEGFSYQLRKMEGYTKSYAQTTVKQLLKDLIVGTSIRLSDKIPDIPLKNIYFKNVRGTDVLEYLKDKCLLTLHFNYDELYCGLRMTDIKGTVRHRIGWNVVKDSELKFERNRELAKVNIRVEKRIINGHKKKAVRGVKDGSEKILKIRHLEDEKFLAQIAEQKRQELLFRGYEGNITGFLVPYVEPGMATRIDDLKYPERTGSYFIERVDGEFSSSGGRQKITIGALLAT